MRHVHTRFCVKGLFALPDCAEYCPVVGVGPVIEQAGVLVVFGLAPFAAVGDLGERGIEHGAGFRVRKVDPCMTAPAVVDVKVFSVTRRAASGIYPLDISKPLRIPAGVPRARRAGAGMIVCSVVGSIRLDPGVDAAAALVVHLHVGVLVFDEFGEFADPGAAFQRSESSYKSLVEQPVVVYESAFGQRVIGHVEIACLVAA